MEKKCDQEQLGKKKKKNKEHLGLGGVLILHEDAAITTVYQILGMAI